MKASDVTAKLADSLAQVVPMLLRLNAVSAILIQAHAEGWADDDPRFATLWGETEKDITTAINLLKSAREE